MLVIVRGASRSAVRGGTRSLDLSAGDAFVSLRGFAMATSANEHTVLVKDRPETDDVFYETAPPSTSAPYGLPHRARITRRGRHRKPRLLNKIGSEHGRRLASFSLIGFSLFAAGIAAQAFLVQVVGVPKVQAFIIQLALSVQVNFLANYHWTWGDRDAPFWRSCWRYNIKRLGGILLTFALYPVLIRLGLNYLAANALLIAALTPANYLLGHFWTFATGDQAPSENDRTAEQGNSPSGPPARTSQTNRLT